MARLFDVVRQLSGQAAAITIPRPYINFCEGNHTHAAVLSQLVFWSSTKPDGEWFYKSNDELGDELCLTVDQVRYAIRQLKKRLGDVILSRVKKANGVPTTHYQIDGERLVELLFPPEKHNSQMDSVKLPDGNGNITSSNRENYQNHGSGKITDSINRSKPDQNEQILDVPSELETAELALFEIPLKGKAQTHGITQSDIDDLKELYPAVDVPQQIRNMIGWCIGNPTKQKTKQGVNRFIHQWLSKEQDRGPKPQVSKSVVSDDRSILKRQIHLLEIDINNENAALLSFQQRKSEAAVQSSKRKLKELLAKREELVNQLGGSNGQ